MQTLTLNESLNTHPHTHRLSSNVEEDFAAEVLRFVIALGVEEFCLCPGSRNSALAGLLIEEPQIKKYYWFEERSGAFFALGRARQSQKPVAIVTTSGTAAGELLPAAMEAYYTGTPLLLITADRPRCFRGKGAPQSAEQKGLFGIYTPFAVDLAAGESFDFTQWDQKAAAYINVCLEEPVKLKKVAKQNLLTYKKTVFAPMDPQIDPLGFNYLDDFLNRVERPLVVVSSLKPIAQEAVVQFLLKLNAPVYLEGISGLRGDPRLNALQITRTDDLWSESERSGYPIDGVLRLGGVPTFRFWRDLEDKQGAVQVCSISETPFAGLSWGSVVAEPLELFFSRYRPSKRYGQSSSQSWIENDRLFREKLEALFLDEPEAEPSLLHLLSRQIPVKSTVYLGNSLPIREWDLAASLEDRSLSVHASRGLNGIDGQISTFLGVCRPETQNWAILGDLTTLYDMAGPWILDQLFGVNVTIVVINNGGGKIFAPMYPYKEFQNPHALSFKPLAEMWQMHYERWHAVPSILKECTTNRLIEIIPNEEATLRFSKRLTQLL